MKTFLVTLENYNGKCKRVKVAALDADHAMAICEFEMHKGWCAVDAALCA